MVETRYNSIRKEDVIKKTLLSELTMKYRHETIDIRQEEYEEQSFRDFVSKYYNFNDLNKIDTAFIIESFINDEYNRGFSIGSYDVRTNISKLYFEWDGIPSFEIQGGSGGSLSCCIYSTFSKAYFNAKNISEASGEIEGNPLYVDVIYITINEEGDIILQLYQKVVAKKIDNIRISKVKVWGYIDPNYRLKSSPGYAVYLTQKDNSTIEGVYNQIQIDINDKRYYEAAIREYKYDSKKGKGLPFDEVMVFKYISSDINVIKDGKRRDYFEHTAYYVPAKGIS